MPDQKVTVNTVEQGVLYFDLKELAEDRQQLELSDFKSFEQLQIEEGFSVSMICEWQPKEILGVMS